MGTKKINQCHHVIICDDMMTCQTMMTYFFNFVPISNYAPDYGAFRTCFGFCVTITKKISDQFSC